MDNVTRHSKDVLLLGDFNFDLNLSQTSWSSVLSLFNLNQLVDQPTRVTESSATLIDHIYTNNRPMVSQVKVASSSISDHKPISCEWACKLPKSKKKGHTTIEYRSFKNFNESDFFQDLSLAPFASVFSESDANTAFELLLNILSPVINKHAPLRRHRVKYPSLPPWLTNDIMEAMATRDTLKEKKLTAAFKKQRNKTTQLIRETKSKYFSKIIEDHKSISMIWRAINDVLDKPGKKPNSSATSITPGEFNTHFLTLADRLTQPLSNHGESESSTAHDKLRDLCEEKLHQGDTFCIPYLAVHEVGKLIECLDSKKSMGPDKIPPKLLKLALPYIVEPLTFVYNLCIEQNVFPSALKIAKVIPLPKGKDVTDPSNFTPISLIPILAKPLEKHIHKHLMGYMENNNLFHKFQSGFRDNHSCQTALTTLCDTWLSSINKPICLCKL